MKNGYEVVKNFITPSFADYLKNYFTLIAENGECIEGDYQAPDSHCIYGDPAFDTLMLMTSPIIEENLNSIFSDEYSVDERISLIGSVIRDGSEISKNISFNDVVIHSKDAVRMIEMDTTLNGKNLYTVNADGLVISTPTGSTAYSLSSGGPILEPNMDALVIVPICPHLLSNRPIVIDMNSIIEIKLSEKSNMNASVTFDGQINVPIQANDIIKISKGEISLKLIQPPGIDFLSILREKLGWGYKP